MAVTLYDARGDILDPTPQPEKRDWRDTALDMMLAESDRALIESIYELEQPLEAEGWRRLTTEAQYEFSPRGRWLLYQIARLMYLKNPLIRRGVEVKVIYVWGLGWSIKCDEDIVNDVIQEFMDDARNAVELTSQQARESKERTQQIKGNTFFVFFPNKSTGLVRVRTILAEEIVDIICDPEDAKTPWFYKRVWQDQEFDPGSGNVSPKEKTAYYPDWHYEDQIPDAIGNQPVMKDTPVYHVKTGGTDDMKFGIPEFYPAIDWAQAAKKQLEDWATVRRALSQFAMKLNTTRGPRGVAAAKARLGTTIGPSTFETNPPSLPGSTFISTEGTDIKAFESRGAQPNPDEGRRLWLMACMVFGVPETFFGDADLGNHATAKTLDRPTELLMRGRQTFWIEVFQQIFSYVIDWSIRAPSGLLSGSQMLDRNGDLKWVLEDDPTTGEPLSRHVDIHFQDILEQEATARVQAIVQAATLGNAQGVPAGTIAPKDVSMMLLAALGVDDLDEVMARMFPEPDEGDALPGDTAQAVAEVREAFAELVKVVGETLEKSAA